MHITELFTLFGVRVDLQDIFSLVIFGIQFTALIYACKLRKFAKIYSKRWAFAWGVFEAAMIMALARRALVTAWGFGLDGGLGVFLRWSNDYIMNFAFSILWVVFLVMLWHWWHAFFQTYLKTPSEIKEVIIEKPEKIIVKEPKTIEVKGT